MFRPVSKPVSARATAAWTANTAEWNFRLRPRDLAFALAAT
jgi:hypothetical protein